MEQHYTENTQDWAAAGTYNAPLTSSEISSLWRTFVSYSAVKWLATHSINHVNDPDIRGLMEDGIKILETRISTSAAYLSQDGQPVPGGFTQEDVDLNAPRLFTDPYYLCYMNSIGKAELYINGNALCMATRADVREFYTECIVSIIRFWNRTVETLMAKGLLNRPPYITTDKRVDTIKKQEFLGGFLLEKRPLLASEIEQLFFGILSNYMGMASLIGFRQVARSKQVRRYMNRGVEIASKHATIFNSILIKEGIPSPVNWEDMVTDSTMPPFSDKLMMFQVSAMNAVGIIDHAFSQVLSMRRDLNINYLRLTGEVMKYAADGTDIMIDNGWFEEPPHAVDRDELARISKH